MEQRLRLIGQDLYLGERRIEPGMRLRVKIGSSVVSGVVLAREGGGYVVVHLAPVHHVILEGMQAEVL